MIMVVLFYGFSGQVSFRPTSVVIRWSTVGFGFGYGYGRKRAISFGRGFGYGHNWTSVTATLSATAETRKTGFGRSLLHYFIYYTLYILCVYVLYNITQELATYSQSQRIV